MIEIDGSTKTIAACRAQSFTRSLPRAADRAHPRFPSLGRDRARYGASIAFLGFSYSFTTSICLSITCPVNRSIATCNPVVLLAFDEEAVLESWSAQRSSRMRNRSSTSAMASRERAPHLEISRCFEIERIASHKIVLSFLTPPSPFRTLTWSGIPRSIEVRGRTTIKSAGPELKKSTERTSTGRRPACSRPRVGRRSASQISPRRGSAI